MPKNLPEDTMRGLTSDEAKKILAKDGLNVIEDKKIHFWQKLIKTVVSPITLMMIGAAGLSMATGKRFDGHFILVLLLINIVVSLWQELKADNAIAKLNEHLASMVTTLRDGNWVKVDSKELVRGDTVKLLSGAIIPADGVVLKADGVAVNEAALTGESLPKNKNQGDELFSGSTLMKGMLTMRVVSTGSRTYFGKTMKLVERSNKKSVLEKDIISVSKFLSLISLAAIIILDTLFLIQKQPMVEILTLDLTILIAGIPISLPTVMTLIIEFGVIKLAKKKVIVRRLSALEDLSNVDFLLTDKTGTLTKNKIEVNKVVTHNGYKEEEVMRWAYLVSRNEEESAIDKAIINKAKQMGVDKKDFVCCRENIDEACSVICDTDAKDKSKKGNYLILDKYVPADSTRKRATAWFTQGSKKIVVTVGAPQIIEEFCECNKEIKENYDMELDKLAKRGYRALAVAINETGDEKKMELLGVLGLADELRPEAASVIDFLAKHGIDTTMVTGDNREITEEIVQKLKMDNKVIDREEMMDMGIESLTGQMLHDTGAFAEIMPEDKYELVKQAKKYFVVASNGDGINDLPAVKEANVGFAVKSSVEALKSAADIVLLSDGIGVIKDAILESRRIFARVYTYSLYRISESERLIVSSAILGMIFKIYPLTPLQLILLALLNDVPIISLAFDRVELSEKPAKVDVKQRFWLSSLFGLTGLLNSSLIFVLFTQVFHMEWEAIQTLFFLKLTVSGHMLIYVAHTKRVWWEYLPSKQVIWAISITQAIATILALTGFFMPTKVSPFWVIFIWVWALLWMQISELMKWVRKGKRK